MRTIIVEDEIPAMLRMRKLISDSNFPFSIVAECDTGAQAIKDIDQLKPDVIFLDIKLLDMSGFQVLSMIKHKPLVIFTTAYHEYALKAFDHFSVDYLTKPITNDRFNESIAKLATMKSYQENTSFYEIQEWIQKVKKKKSFIVKQRDKAILLDHEDISHFISEDKYLRVHLLSGKSYLINQTISHLEEELPETFIRVHRSRMININNIAQLRKLIKGRYLITMNDVDRSQLQTSYKYRNRLVSMLKL